MGPSANYVHPTCRRGFFDVVTKQYGVVEYNWTNYYDAHTGLYDPNELPQFDHEHTTDTLFTMKTGAGYAQSRNSC